MRTCILRKRLRALIAAVCMVMFLFGRVPGPAAVCRADADAGADPAGIRCEAGNENCLLAEILYKQTCGEEISDAERVLLLFLEASVENPDTSSAETAESEREVIRDRITEETISRIASETGLGEGYVKRLISASRPAPF
ncbi:MAG: hypothetical protein J6E44_01845 [Lachnospiraceae bacterium]|nr:hypothetical protein [Lachnospiraceae bacterium]